MLRREVAEDMTYAEIAKLHGRSEGAIEARWLKLVTDDARSMYTYSSSYNHL